MKKCYVLVFHLLLTHLCFSQSNPANNNESSNASFIVEVNGKEYSVKEGEELSVGTNKIKVKLAASKKFTNDRISFDYPSNFSYEYEEDIGFRNWIFDGNDFVIMYFEIDAPAEIDDFANEMVAQFGEGNYKIETSQKKIGGKLLDGQNIVVALIGQQLTIDVYKIEGAEGKSSFIVFQDLKEEDGNPTQESIKTMDMLDRTIDYK